MSQCPSRASMRTLFVGLLICCTALAGCTDGAEGDGNITENDAAMDTNLSDDSIEAGPPLLDIQDPWGAADSIEIFRQTLTSSEACFYASGATDQHRKPCYVIAPGSADAIPVGSSQLIIQVNGVDAPLFVSVYLPWTEYDQWSSDQESSSHEWEFDLDPAFWDLTEQSWLDLVIYGEDSAAGLPDAEVVVTAVRDQEWSLLPQLDPWQDLDNHTLTEEGSMVLASFTETYEFEGNLQSEFPDGERPVQVFLDDLVPPGTTALTVGMRLISYDACEPGADRCSITFDYWSGRTQDPNYSMDGGEVSRGTDWLAVAYTDPDWIRPDAPWGAVSLTWMRAILTPCFGDVSSYDGCGGQASLDSDMEVTVQVEAWPGEPDMNAFKERLGVA